MRPWIYRIAYERGVTGRVWNHASGVTIDAFGTPESLDDFIHELSVHPPPAAHTDVVATQVIAPENVSAFEIVDSRAGAERRVSIPADLATCGDCLAELFDPADRRYRYAFTNCTNCGPRFTIARDVPYDRSTTTMTSFPMCPRCQREYEDPTNRRFHAEPNACPDCGPHLWVLSPDGERIYLPEGIDPVTYAARAIEAGRIVAVKGLGGFHLACDATSSGAVARLRLRKHRDEKPLAVMVRDLAAARQLAVIDAASCALLESVERPIVLVPRRVNAPLAREVAPNNPLVGLMLAYTPLHHLLLADAAVPLVMTSGNFSDEPIAFHNDEAVRRLHNIADVLLVHDREIVTRCDDSVAITVAGAPTILRRSRGFVPRSIQLPRAVPVPVLACGALLKNTFCIAQGQDAWLGPHIGDLENLETYEAYQEAIHRMERFLGVQPEVLAHDLHPDYLSTHYARGRTAQTIAVQHHHAHVVSAMAEHGLDGTVLGLAFDGTGYGTDGTSWGGEFLIADAHSMRRVATFRPLPLPGGDAAIAHPWRMALSMLIDAMGDAAPLSELSLFQPMVPTDVDVLRRMLAAELNSPLVRGVGRYFDAIGALVLGRSRAQYEGQLAFELNVAADPAERQVYDFAIDRSSPLIEIDFRPLVRAVVDDLRAGVARGIVAARFHNTVIAAAARVAREVTRTMAPSSSQPPQVVLTGGCFQNVRLAEGLVVDLGADHDVFVHRQVPPGDGGIALGQAVVAATTLERG
jgi:hydrogenase maturation protein HypF